MDEQDIKREEQEMAEVGADLTTDRDFQDVEEAKQYLEQLKGLLKNTAKATAKVAGSAIKESAPAKKMAEIKKAYDEKKAEVVQRFKQARDIKSQAKSMETEAKEFKDGEYDKNDKAATREAGRAKTAHSDFMAARTGISKFRTDTRTFFSAIGIKAMIAKGQIVAKAQALTGKGDKAQETMEQLKQDVDDKKQDLHDKNADTRMNTQKANTSYKGVKAQIKQQRDVADGIENRSNERSDKFYKFERGADYSTTNVVSARAITGVNKTQMKMSRTIVEGVQSLNVLAQAAEALGAHKLAQGILQRTGSFSQKTMMDAQKAATARINDLKQRMDRKESATKHTQKMADKADKAVKKDDKAAEKWTKEAETAKTGKHRVKFTNTLTKGVNKAARSMVDARIAMTHKAGRIVGFLGTKEQLDNWKQKQAAKNTRTMDRAQKINDTVRRGVRSTISKTDQVRDFGENFVEQVGKPTVEFVKEAPQVALGAAVMAKEKVAEKASQAKEAISLRKDIMSRGVIGFFRDKMSKVMDSVEQSYTKADERVAAHAKEDPTKTANAKEDKEDGSR